MNKIVITVIAGFLLLCACCSQGTMSFKTDYFGLDVDSHGYIVGMWNLTRRSRNFSPTDQPSPLLSLYNGQNRRSYYPLKAVYNKSKKEYKLEEVIGTLYLLRIKKAMLWIKCR